MPARDRRTVLIAARGGMGISVLRLFIAAICIVSAFIWMSWVASQSKKISILDRLVCTVIAVGNIVSALIALGVR